MVYCLLSIGYCECIASTTSDFVSSKREFVLSSSDLVSTKPDFVEF